MDQGIKINILVSSNAYTKFKRILIKTSHLTKNNKITVNLAINYGSKFELINTFKKTKGKLNIKILKKSLYEITTISRYFSKNWWTQKIE